MDGQDAEDSADVGKVFVKNDEPAAFH